MDLFDTIQAALASIPKTHADLRWAYANGYLARTPNPDAPTRVPPLPKPGEPAEGGDYVKAPTHDIGIGEHESRQAYATAVLRIASAAGHLRACVETISGERERAWEIVPTNPNSVLDVLDRIEAVLPRVGRVAGLRRLPPKDQTTVEDRLRRLCTALLSARDVLHAALSKGPADGNGKALENRCRICGRREAAPKEEKIGQICRDCKNAEYAPKRSAKAKTKRKRNRDDGAVQRKGAFRQALDAQDRRRARGEDTPLDEDFGCVAVVRLKGA